MILREGRHEFRRDECPDRPFALEYASVSASGPSWMKVWVEDELIEEAFIGSYSPHTWWGNNPLVTEKQQPAPGQRVVIEVGPGAIMRLESNLIPTYD